MAGIRTNNDAVREVISHSEKDAEGVMQATYRISVCTDMSTPDAADGLHQAEEYEY